MNAMNQAGRKKLADELALTAPIAPFSSLTDVAFAQVRRLYEALTPTRETLALLFALDAAQINPTEQWTCYFVEAASAQLIWDERPTGRVTAADAAWVLARFDEAPTLAALAVLARLVEEAHAIPAGFAHDVRQRAMLFSSVVGLRPNAKAGSHLRLVA